MHFLKNDQNYLFKTKYNVSFSQSRTFPTTLNHTWQIKLWYYYVQRGKKIKLIIGNPDKYSEDKQHLLDMMISNSRGLIKEKQVYSHP